MSNETQDRMNAGQDRWIPKLSSDGIHYCSDACGGGKFCLKEDYDRAVIRASNLAARMGEGWTTVIHENLGWHHKVKKGSFTVYEYKVFAGSTYQYCVWFEPGRLGLHNLQMMSIYCDDPLNALYEIRERIALLIEEARNTLDAMEEEIS